jgi:hypothetical protein
MHKSRIAGNTACFVLIATWRSVRAKSLYPSFRRSTSMAQRPIRPPVPVVQPEGGQQDPVVPQPVNVVPDAAGPAQPLQAQNLEVIF